MSSFIGNIVKNNTDISDNVILTNMLVASNATATAYFFATMASTTPELRSMLSTSLTQVMGNYAALSELAVKHGWEKPYDRPVQQLADAYMHSAALQQ